MMEKLVAIYKSGGITGHHLVLEALHRTAAGTRQRAGAARSAFGWP